MGLAGLGIGGVIPNVVAKRRHNSDFVIHCRRLIPAPPRCNALAFI